MTKATKITATYAEVPFAETYISELNPRQIVSEAGIEALAENIRQCGLIHPLAGLTDAKGQTAIVAGGRRHRALALLQDDPRFQMVAVNIAPDEATAQAWASSENANREALHPADEIRDYGDMAARGLPVPSIAVAYGVTEKHVYRRLKLASLPAPVIQALREDAISLSNAAAFTVSEDEANTLTVLEQVRGQGYSDHRIKDMLKPDAVRSTDRRVVFVGYDDYVANGGRVTADLFAEQTFFDDVALLDDLFRAKLTLTAEAMKAEGWKWAEGLGGTYVGYHEIEERKLDRIYCEEGVLTDAQNERYNELADLAEGEGLDEAEEAELADLHAVLDGVFSAEQKAVSGVLLYVDHSGAVRTYDGLVLKEDKAAAIEAGFLRPSRHASGDDAPKSPISQKLRDDLDRVAQGARQHAALRDPDLLIDLLAYQFSHALRWNDPYGISRSDVPNWPSTEAEGYALDDRLTTNPPRDMWDAKDFGASFRAFRKKGPDHVRGELVRFLAAQYRGGDKTLEAMIDKETQPAIRDVWTPTAANFFSRVGGPYLADLWRDLLGLAEDHPTATSFIKLNKSEKVEKLDALFSGDPDLRRALGVTDEQAARIDTWLPEGMA